MNLVDTAVVSNSDVNGTTPGYDHAINLSGVTGEFVRVTLGPDLVDSYLSFSELQVFEAAGDFNRDGHINAADISQMELALTNPSAYKSLHPDLSDQDLAAIEDVNGDGKFTIADLQDLLIILKSGGGSNASVPEPSTIAHGWIGLNNPCSRRPQTQN